MYKDGHDGHVEHRCARNTNPNGRRDVDHANIFIDCVEISTVPKPRRRREHFLFVVGTRADHDGWSCPVYGYERDLF